MTNKKILVEILRTVAGIGKQGERKEVSLLQARNQLIPQGLAREILETWAEVATLREQILTKKDQIAAALHDQDLRAQVAAGGQKLQEHFDGEKVVELIKRQFHLKLLPDMIRFDGVKHPKELGDYTVYVDLDSSVYIKMRLHISKL